MEMMSTPPTAHTTRFAPSPTGRLHLGHVFAALFAHRAAHIALGGRFLIRIEDIDATRARPDFEAAIFDDLAWLGLTWELPVLRQSDHLHDYRAALDTLEARGLLYPCFCTRREIQDEIARAGDAPQGPDGPLYPGTCRSLSADQRRQRMDSGAAYALRLDVGKACRQLAAPLFFTDLTHGTQEAKPDVFGDVVLARKDTPASYHLAVVVDDARQGITVVTRGEDLLPATHLHRLLQHLLGLPVPLWQHHRLITDETGRRLAKRDNDRSIESMRLAGYSPQDILSTIGML